MENENVIVHLQYDNSKYKIMSTAELEMKKARLARKILSEKDEKIIVSFEDIFRKIKRSTINVNERKKLIREFLHFVEVNSITDLDFKFKREDCYDRKMFL